MDRKKEFRRFCILQAAHWGYCAAFPGYVAAYMLSLGVSSWKISLILAGNMLSSFLGTIFWGRKIDQKQTSRRYYIQCEISAAVLCVFIYFMAGNASAMLLLYAALGFFTGFGGTALDGWVISRFPERRDAVGRSRSFATLSYAFVILSTGFLIRMIGYQILLVSMAAMLSISLAAAAAQPDMPQSGMNYVQRDGGLRQLGELASIPDYRLLLVLVFLTGLTIAPLNNMKAVVMQELGSTVSMVGIDGFIGCMIQVPFLFFSARFARIPSAKRLMIAVTAPLGYAAFILAARSPWTVVAGTICSNISFGIFFPTMREITENVVAPRLRNTAHSMIDASYNSLSGVLAMTGSGMIIAEGGVKAMAMTCTLMQMVPIALMLGFLLRGQFGKLPAGKVQVRRKAA